MNIQFATGSYLHPSLPISAQRAVNLYAEKEPPDAKTPVALLGAPGLVAFATAGSGPIRGFCDMAGLLYTVSGDTLYSVSSGGTATSIGGLISGTGIVSMDTNGSDLVITNGTNGYVYNASTGFSLITDTDFNAANTVTFFDQRLCFDKANSNQWFISESLDGASYDALAIASAEARPDYVKAVVLDGQVLFVMGERTIEPWQDVGAANFPFERVSGGLIERGLLAPHAFTKADNTFFWLGENRILYRRNGLTPQRVSNHAIEAEWQTYTVTGDAFLFSYFFNGHEFVVVNWPSQPATWVFDISSGLPHERDSRDMSNNSLGRWRVNCTINMYGKWLAGDAYTGQIGYLDSQTSTEYGNTIVGLATSPPIHKDRKRVFMPRFELDVESGVGLTTGQGSDPQIMLDYSDDGGRTFSNRQMWKSMGALGSFRQRLKWDRLGQSRNRVMRITVSDPVRRTIVAAHADTYLGM